MTVFAPQDCVRVCGRATTDKGYTGERHTSGPTDTPPVVVPTEETGG